jgi:hypothetical protein
LVLCFDEADVEEGHESAGIGVVAPAEIDLAGEGSGRTIEGGKAVIQGPLDEAVVGRIVQAHTKELHHCYDAGPTTDPELEVSVELDFTIGSLGSVYASDVHSSTLSDETVGRCIAKAVKRWRFPRPKDGGVVSVKYPVALSPR